MALLDPLFQGFSFLFSGLDRLLDSILQPDPGEEQASESLGGIIEDIEPFSEPAGFLIDTVEETVLAPLQETGPLTPENVEGVADETEGAAAGLLAGTAAASTQLEAATLGQVDKQSEFLVQALAGLGIDDVTGMELEARISEGVMPALEAKVGKEHRSKFVDISDAVEYALRNKETDGFYLRQSGAPEKVVNAIGSNNQLSQENILEEWGIRGDQLRILEEVAINGMEFEELIETPAELGLVVPDDVLQQELDRAGYGEDTKEFLAQVNNRIRDSARVYQELLTTEELVPQLDTLAREGLLTPQQATDTVPEDIDVDREELRARFQLLRDLPAGGPSQSEVVDSVVLGFIDLQEARARIDQADIDLDQFEDVLQAEIQSEVDGDMQRALGLGLMSDSQFDELARFAGLDDDIVQLARAGRDLDDVASRRLQDSDSDAGMGLQGLNGVGESRAEALQAVGIEDVRALAQADVETVADALAASPETAQRLVQQAQLRVQASN